MNALLPAWCYRCRWKFSEVYLVVGVQPHSHSLYLPESKILLSALSYTTQSCLCTEVRCVCCLYTCVYLCVCVCVKWCQVELGVPAWRRATEGKCAQTQTLSLPLFFSLLLLTQLVSGLVPVKMDHGWNTIHGSHSWPACNEGRTGTNLPEMDGTKCIHQKLKLRSGDLSLVLIQS